MCLSEKLNIETVIPHFIQIPLCWMSFSPLTAISVAATVNASVIVISFLIIEKKRRKNGKQRGKQNFY